MAALDAASQPDDTPAFWKFLVVVDETPECDNAIRFAALRAAKTNGGVSLLYIIDPPDFQHWMSVEEVMREEAREEGQLLLDKAAQRIRNEAGIEPTTMIREGKAINEILDVIKDDPGIRILVLAAGTGKEGPGPLVSSFSGQMLGALPIAMTIVPGHLPTDQIDQIT
ncbi:MAG: universal stress protein [Alphaproteobacteria bacterium]